MFIEKAVHCSVRKGLGPDWVDREVIVGLDDLPEDTSDEDIRLLVSSEAKRQLQDPQYPDGVIVNEIHGS